ncbi:hypothetical protein V5N11_002418 [Cardamine amara subsp. amara]|uniref:Retrotransposon gag domain-containing protein n=1 Tax=Cardamine amara subsp. amara TaxID=228776 RepID=A0ABD1C6W6_CARAN
MPGTGGDEEASNIQNNKLLLEALTAEMRRMLAAGMETLRKEFRQNTNQEQRRAEPRRDQERSPERERDPRRQPRDEAADAYYCHHSGSSHRSQRRQRRFREDGGHQQDNFNGLKLRIPPFHGKNDPDTYLEWEKKIELVFNCQHYTEANRVKVAATEFYDYALSWWDQLVTSRRRNQEYPVET